MYLCTEITEMKMNLKKNIQKHKRLNEVAQYLGVTASALTQSIASENMSMARLVKIAEFCGCSIDALVYGEGTEATENKQNVCPHCGKPISIKIE